MSLIIPLCSSSGGNAAFIGRRNSGVLVDVGCSLRQLRNLLNICQTSLEAVEAVFITHEHTDHVKGLFQLTKHFPEIPIYASAGTLRALINDGLVHSCTNLYEVSQAGNARIDYKITAFSTSHDAEESIGLIFENDDYKIAYCTDLGKVTEEVRSSIKGSEFVFIESNYEPVLLQKNPKYPYYLKKRIASEVGHLPNTDCAEFLAELLEGGTKRFILGHLSRENNTPALAFENAVKHLAKQGAVHNKDYTLEIAPVVNEGRVVAV